MTLRALGPISNNITGLYCSRYRTAIGLSLPEPVLPRAAKPADLISQIEDNGFHHKLKPIGGKTISKSNFKIVILLLSILLFFPVMVQAENPAIEDLKEEIDELKAGITALQAENALAKRFHYGFK